MRGLQQAGAPRTAAKSSKPQAYDPVNAAEGGRQAPLRCGFEWGQAATIEEPIVLPFILYMASAQVPVCQARAGTGSSITSFMILGTGNVAPAKTAIGLQGVGKVPA